jgi:Glycosyl transferase family 2
LNSDAGQPSAGIAYPMTPDTTPLISVVIPVKNGGLTIEAALQGLLAQTLADRTEIIVIDSGSRDDTLDIVRRYPVTVHEIPAAEFNHGATRNLGVKMARGDFVVMTVQDAAPADTHWLATMLRHFDDPEVAGVCGKQITTHDLDKNPMEWHRPMGEPQVSRLQFACRRDYEALPGHARMAASAWDDVTAMYRKSVLLDLPFRTTMFGEDFFWANDALALGRAALSRPAVFIPLQPTTDHMPASTGALWPYRAAAEFMAQGRTKRLAPVQAPDADMAAKGLLALLQPQALLRGLERPPDRTRCPGTGRHRRTGQGTRTLLSRSASGDSQANFRHWPQGRHLIRLT